MRRDTDVTFMFLLPFIKAFPALFIIEDLDRTPKCLPVGGLCSHAGASVAFMTATKERASNSPLSPRCHGRRRNFGCVHTPPFVWLSDKRTTLCRRWQHCDVVNCS